MLTVTHAQANVCLERRTHPDADAVAGRPPHQLQVDDASDFKSPAIDIATTAASYTPIKGISLPDGQWYWRVASYEATGRPGPFSAPQTFFKQYPLPTPVQPGSNAATDKTPRFAWQPASGAAYYILYPRRTPAFRKHPSIPRRTRATLPRKRVRPGSNYLPVKMVYYYGRKAHSAPPVTWSLLYLPYINR